MNDSHFNRRWAAATRDLMNRLCEQPLAASLHAPALAEPSWLSAGTFATTGEGATHSLFAPLHYEPNYGYPLFVWLHGGGQSEQQLRRIMPLVSLRNYAAVAPRGTLAMPQGNSRGGYQWSQVGPHVDEAYERVQAAIVAAHDRFNIRPDRIFLAGYQSGGTMALRLALENADQFAGVLSLCGPLPTTGTPLAKLHSLRRLPLLLSACRHGVHYPTDRVCDDLRLAHAAGMSITLREYPGEDGLPPSMLADVDRWMMEQIAQPVVADAVA